MKMSGPCLLQCLEKGKGVLEVWPCCMILNSTGLWCCAAMFRSPCSNCIRLGTKELRSGMSQNTAAYVLSSWHSAMQGASSFVLSRLALCISSQNPHLVLACLQGKTWSVLHGLNRSPCHAEQGCVQRPSKQLHAADLYALHVLPELAVECLLALLRVTKQYFALLLQQASVHPAIVHPAQAGACCRCRESQCNV